MVKKIDKVCGTIITNTPDNAVITESWSTSHVTNQLISIPNYTTFSKDRVNEQLSGGLCTYMNSHLDAVELSHLCNPEIESQWLVIKLNRLPRGINTIILATIYHPPQKSDNPLQRPLVQMS
jgi:hypothetical protein